jgi:EAL domain-containing protein (putative c-di-GMP-specific phosphodiesterase class I)
MLKRLPQEPLHEDLLLVLPKPLAHLLRNIRKDDAGKYELFWKGHRIRSVFQPIVSLTHNCIVGHEALIRPSTPAGEPISPPEFLSKVLREGDLAWVDRACRAMQVLNFGQAPGWIFLNYHPASFKLENADEVSALFLHFLIDIWHVNPHWLVVEVVEVALGEYGSLEASAQSLKAFGVNVALDDFGAGASNFDRIWDFEPEIVKLDKCFAQRSDRDPKIRRLLPRIVEMLHESGSQVVMEGVETVTQAKIAIDSNIDFVQGWLLARPKDEPMSDPYVLEEKIDAIWRFNEQEQDNQNSLLSEVLERVRSDFSIWASRLTSLKDFHSVSRGFLELQSARRMYLIGRDGRIVDGPLAAACRGLQGRPCTHCDSSCPAYRRHRFEPIENTRTPILHAHLSRQPYFRNAVENPGVSCISMPYISFFDSKMTGTLSHTVEIGGDTYILCGDLDWHSLQRQPLMPILIRREARPAKRAGAKETRSDDGSIQLCS